VKYGILNEVAGEANMSGQRHRKILVCLLFFAAASPFKTATADTFGRVYYDKNSGELVVTMHYRGTNPNHHFSLQWGSCQTDPSSNLLSVDVDILDDQFEDAAQQSFKKTTRFSLTGLPCARPVSVTLRSAPRFRYTIAIPG
jgi:hypothetical protein